MPVEAGSALERVPRPQHTRIVERPAGNLERERKALASETAKHGQRGPAGAIERRCQVWPRPEGEDVVPVEARGSRAVGRNEQVKLAIERSHLAQDGAALAACAHVVLRREQTRGQAARSEVLSKLLGSGDQLG